jgi:membrane protease YdiL (CAAX protease family)
MKLTENIVRWPSTIFFLLAFLVSWCVWIPAIRPLQGLRTFDVAVWAIVLLLVGGAGPSIAAIVVTHAIGGTRAVKESLADFLRWDVGSRWYAVVILQWVFLFLAAVPVCAAVSGQPPVLQPKQALLLVPTYALWFLFALPTGPCLEEQGWRGFALPQLQQRYSALTSGVIVGVAWCLWHVPLFFVPGLSFPGGETILTAPAQIVWTGLGTIGASIIFTWVYNNTRGSLLLAVLFHASLNATPNALRPFFYPEASGEFITIISRTHLVLMWLVAIGLVALFGPRHLSRDAPTWLDESRRVVHFN